MGIVLLLITLIVKFAVYPLMKKSYISSANMRVLRPKIDEINAKYTKPEDAMVKQQETMKLYSEYGVSPMGGCLPMLIQMPIWIALFNFIPNAIELRGQSFLWAKDLSAYDDVIQWGTNIWGIGDHISIFCVLWCLSTVVNTWISMRQQQYSMTPEQEQSMKMMKWMSYLMPLIFFFSFNNYASGLTYYYFISGLISIIMMWYLRKTPYMEREVLSDADVPPLRQSRHEEMARAKRTGMGQNISLARLHRPLGDRKRHALPLLHLERKGRRYFSQRNPRAPQVLQERKVCRHMVQRHPMRRVGQTSLLRTHGIQPSLRA